MGLECYLIIRRWKAAVGNDCTASSGHVEFTYEEYLNNPLINHA